MLAICTCVHVQNSQYVLSQCIDHDHMLMMALQSDND